MPRTAFIQTQRARIPRARLFAAAVLLSGVLVAGCGGSSGAPTTRAVGGATASRPGTATTAASTTAASATNSDTTTPNASAWASALAFAKCMRANGVPNFPDPEPGAGDRFPIAAGTNTATPAFQSADAKCQKLLPSVGAPGEGAGPSAKTMAKLRQIAVCMRKHGVPQFPDPQSTRPSVQPGEHFEITDFDGAFLVWPVTINMQSPAYKQALTACGAPPLGLAH